VSETRRNDFVVEFLLLSKAIDNLLVVHEGLRASLAKDHLPFDRSFAEAMRQYGNGPLLHLWNECKAVEALRIQWTGKPTPGE
jgi:hypothetical protein